MTDAGTMPVCRRAPLQLTRMRFCSRRCEQLLEFFHGDGCIVAAHVASRRRLEHAGRRGRTGPRNGRAFWSARRGRPGRTAEAVLRFMTPAEALDLDVTVTSTFSRRRGHAASVCSSPTLYSPAFSTRPSRRTGLALRALTEQWGVEVACGLVSRGRGWM